MTQIFTSTETHTYTDENGVVHESKKSSSKKLEKDLEPDYIKIYTRMWCDFNQIPLVYQDLFLQLAVRMSYCNSTNLKHSQLVNTGRPWSDDIMAALGWKQRMYQKGLKKLCDFGAIKQVARGVYQINPSYAGKGEWFYNPRQNRGGVKDLIAVFNFKEGSVDTDIVWADDGTDSEINDVYRSGLDVKASDNAVLQKTTVKPTLNDEAEIPGQISIADMPDTIPEPLPF